MAILVTAWEHVPLTVDGWVYEITPIHALRFVLPPCPRVLHRVLLPTGPITHSMSEIFISCHPKQPNVHATIQNASISLLMGTCAVHTWERRLIGARVAHCTTFLSTGLLVATGMCGLTYCGNTIL